MNKYIKQFFTYAIILAGLVGSILFFRSCGDDKPVYDNRIPYDTIQIVRDTVYRTDTFTSDNYIPVVKYKVKSKLDTVTLIDTEYVISNYYATNVYQDTISFDTMGNVIVFDSIRYNTIVSRKWVSNINTKTVYTNTFLQPKQSGIYVGGSAVISNGFYIGPQVSVLNSNSRLYTIGVLTNGKLPMIQVGASFKLK